MNLYSAMMILLVLLALVVTPSQAIPKWVWIPDDLFPGLSDNATSRQDGAERPLPRPRPRPRPVRVRDDEDWNINQQNQNVIVHNHEHIIYGYPGFGGGYRPQGENWEEDSTNDYQGGKKYNVARGREHFERVMDCKQGACHTLGDETNAQCRKDFGNESKYYDLYNFYKANDGCFAYAQKRTICCKAKPYCKYTSCRDDKYSGKQVCKDLGGGYQFTGHYSLATCGQSLAFSAYCCIPGHGVPTTGT